MSYTPKILAFAGSLRAQSHNKKVVGVAAEGARKAGAEVTFLNLKDLPMPIYDADLVEEHGFDRNATEFQQILLAHDGLLIASPEYNASLPAALKNAIDWASRANGEVKLGATFKGKVAGIMSASPGSFGGIRCLSHLRAILSILGVFVLPDEFAISAAHEAFDDNGLHKDEKMHSLLEQHGANVVEILKKMRG
ncbi:MAG: NAD(P)H-dependent oxidoreductase [Pyrinomonadaceae bacterium]